MRIGGLLKFSLIDFPGRVSAVIFTQGCNYRCPFCHNPELVLPDLFAATFAVEEVLSFLEKRKGQLQGVVITGGEPTLHDDLPDLLRRIRAMGYLIKLDTNGSRPDMLRRVIDEGLVDHIAMDIKASINNYCKATGVAVDIEMLKLSVAAIKASGVAHEFRTTALRELFKGEDIAAVREWIGVGAPYQVRRGNRKGKMLDPAFIAAGADYTDEEWDTLTKLVHEGGEQ